MKASPLNVSTLAAALLALAGVGCIHTKETVYKEEPRAKVEFENDTAARLFYEAIANLNNKPKTEASTTVSLPVIFSHEKRVVRGENDAFNKAVARADTNRDGSISESEARIYADSVRR